jgi:hypothetical protein
MAAAVAHLDDPRYWLAHCEGFEVRDPAGLLGWVEEVELDPETGSVRALSVSPSHVHPGSLRVPARAVRLVIPERGFVLVGRRTFGCASCGFRAGGRSAPPRCPMCGGGSWELV